MKAVVYHQYGGPEVLQVEEVARPHPKENEVLIRVHAAAVNYGDLIARNFKAVTPDKFNMPALLCVFARLSFGWQKPRLSILGSEFAGVIEATGRDVKRFRAGDAVFGYLGERMGAYAEYVCMPEDGTLAHKPANLSFEQAAAVPYGALTALSLLRKAGLQRGETVLVNGASGAIGSAALQLAKHHGAEVTGVCGTPRMAFVKALGAAKIIDYTREDFTQNGERYDLIVDVLGKASFERCKGSLKPGGRILYASFKSKHLLQMAWNALTGGPKIICTLSSIQPGDLALIESLCEAGQIQSIVDRCYPAAQAADAHRYAESGHKQGSVVITFRENKG